MSETGPFAGGMPRHLILLLVALNAIGPMSLNIIVPALPAIATTLEADPARVQFLVSFYLLGLATSQIVLGSLSDRFGRRPVMLVGIAIASLASLMAAFSASITALTIARIAQSFGASTGIVVGRAMIRDLYDREHATAMIGLVTTAMVVVPMLSPLVGGILDTAFGWRAIFLFITLVGTGVVVWAAFGLPETRPAPSADHAPGRTGSDLKALGTDRKFIAFVLIAGFGTAPFFAFLGGGPYVVVTMMGRTSAEYGVWFAIPAVGFMLGTFTASRLAVRVKVETVLFCGAGLTIFSTGLATLLVWLIPDSGPAPVFLPQVITSYANGLLIPNAMAGAVSVRPQAAGTASGITGFTQMAIGAGAVQLATIVLRDADTAISLTLLMLAFGVVAAFSCLLLLKKQPTA